jgi:hypothetical protein
LVTKICRPSTKGRSLVEKIEQNIIVIFKVENLKKFDVLYSFHQPSRMLEMTTIVMKGCIIRCVCDVNVSPRKIFLSVRHKLTYMWDAYMTAHISSLYFYINYKYYFSS